MGFEAGLTPERASAETLLQLQGSLHLRPAAEEAAARLPRPDGVYCDLQVDRDWASLRVGSTQLTPAPGALQYLEAAGFRPPDGIGRSPSTRAWFRSWAFTTPAARVASAAEILESVRSAFRVGADAPITMVRGPSGRAGDPGRPIVAVLLALFAGYSIVAGWAVLALWDVFLPGRAHPQAAGLAQVVAPVVTLIGLLAYAVILPDVRLRWVAARRAPSAAEIDRQVPGTTWLGFVGPPIVLLLLLLASGA